MSKRFSSRERGDSHDANSRAFIHHHNLQGLSKRARLWYKGIRLWYAAPLHFAMFMCLSSALVWGSC